MRSSFFYTLLSLYLAEFGLAASCARDSCLKALNNNPTSASSFCTPYLATTQTATTGIPTFLSHCQSSTSRLSSACSCIFISTTITSSSASSPASTTSNASSSSTFTSKSNSATPSSSASKSSSTFSSLTSTFKSISVISSSSYSTTGPASTQPSCTAASRTITTTFTSNPTCPSVGAASTITSVSTSTVTVTTTAVPTCFPRIVGGDFTSSSQNINAFTVTQNPPGSIFYQVLSPAQQEFLSVTDGTPQFLFLNYALLPSSFGIAQSITAICSPYTSLALSATINAQSSDGTVTFCINPTICSTQAVAATNGKFVQYSATFPATVGVAITASMNLAVNDFVPIYFAGIGSFQVTAF